MHGWSGYLFSPQSVPRRIDFWKIWVKNIENLGISVPFRTTSFAKFGKIIQKNESHVGSIFWSSAAQPRRSARVVSPGFIPPGTIFWPIFPVRRVYYTGVLKDYSSQPWTLVPYRKNLFEKSWSSSNLSVAYFCQVFRAVLSPSIFTCV